MDSLRKLRSLLSPRERRRALILLGMMLAGAALEMLGVGAIPAFVALLSNPRRVEQIAPIHDLLARWSIHSDRAIAFSGAVALLAIVLVKNAYIGVLAAVQSRYVMHRQVAIAGRLFRAYLESPYTFHLQRNTAELLRNATAESMEVVGSALMPALTLTLELLTVAAILLLLLFAEPLISLVAFVLLGGATLVFVRMLRRRLVHYGEQIQVNRLEMIRAVHEGLGGVKITKALGREEHFLTAFARSADRYAEATRFRQVMLELPRLYLEVAAVFGVLGVAVVLLVEQRPIQAIIPILSLLAVAIVRMIPSFNRITSSLTTLRYGHFSVDVVHADLIPLERARTRAKGTGDDTSESPAKRMERALELREIRYRYPGAASAALEGVSCEIPVGAAVGFVGPSGSGKTTLVDVMLGLLEPTGGEILLDGRRMELERKGWQRRIGYVPQDIYLLDDTIRRNVAFGLAPDEIDDEALARAVDSAQLTSFVKSLPTGLDTIVGERGIRLSGGQRQRIGIARALYHEPEVLILDEATSSLDGETERFVMQAVERLRGQRTIVIVAHRMSTVRHCDRLFMLDGGRVIGCGTYDELIRGNHDFRRIAAAT